MALKMTTQQILGSVHEMANGCGGLNVVSVLGAKKTQLAFVVKDDFVGDGCEQVGDPVTVNTTNDQ